MKTAIDFYERGKEKESNADDYNHLLRFPSDRFVCPVCGEKVFLTRGKYSNHFSHYKKTSDNDECDRRIDGIPTESIYVRTGLPLYISRESENDFRLHISFRALRMNTLARLNDADVSVLIGDHDRYWVNSERFSTDYSTWIPVSDVKSLKNSVSVAYDGDADLVKELQRYWGTYAEGFSVYGSIFAGGSERGRKLHSGDSISTGLPYYWVTTNRYFMHNVSGVSLVNAGQLLLNTTSYSVYKFEISTNLSDVEFRSLSSVLLSYFKLHLLEQNPSAVPIWPPINKIGDGYTVRNGISDIYAHVESGNSIPKVYCYRGNEKSADELPLDSNKLIVIPMRDSQMLINIDLKFVSNGLFLTRIYDSSLKNAMEKCIQINGDQNIYGSSVVVSDRLVSLRFSEKSDVIHIKRKRFVFYSDVDEIQIGDFSNGDRVLIYFSSMLVGILSCLVADSTQDSIIINELGDLFIKYRNASKVVMPNSVRALLQNLKDESWVVPCLLNEYYIAKPILAYLEGFIHEGYRI